MLITLNICKILIKNYHFWYHNLYSPNSKIKNKVPTPISKKIKIANNKNFIV